MEKIFFVIVVLLISFEVNSQIRNDSLRRLVIEPQIATTNNFAVTITPNQVFQSYPKTEFTQQVINGCTITPILYQVSEHNIGIFFAEEGIKNDIYPGAIYKVNDIISENFSPYHLEYPRNEMDLTTNILAFENSETVRRSNAVQSNKVVINVFDYGSITEKWNELLGRSINGNTPGRVKKYLQVVESSSQLKSDFKTTGTVNVSTKIGLAELPDIPVTVNIENKVSVANTEETRSELTNNKNTIVLKYEQIFYSASMTPKAGVPDLFKNIANDQLDEDLVYVQSVDYGMIYYITVTSDKSKSHLYKAIQKNVQTSTGVSGTFPIEGVPVSAEVDVQTTVNDMSTSEAQNILNSTEIKVYQWGGELINDMSGDLNSILTQLYERRRFSSTNLGYPISYTLAYANNHGNAWINYDSKYASANCGNVNNFKYDVLVTLKQLKCIKAVDWGFGSDDEIYGQVRISYWAVRNNSGNVLQSDGTNKYFWNKSNSQYQKFKTGDIHDFNKTFTISGRSNNGFSYDELMGLEIWLKAIIKDDEGDNDITYDRCIECTADNGNRVYYLKNSKTEIDDRFISGRYDSSEGEILDYGNDKYTRLTCYENRYDVNSACMAAKLQFKVILHND